jgi:integrase
MTANYQIEYRNDQIQPKPWEDFKKELLGLYAPGLRAAATRRGLEYVIRCLEGLDGGIQSTADFSCDLIGRFIASRPAGNSPNSTRGYLRYLQALCGYAQKSGYLHRSPFAIRGLSAWVRPAKPQAKKHCSREEIAKVLEHMRTKAAAGGWAGWNDKRTYAMTAGLAMTGARAGEIIWLQAQDVDLEQGLIRIVSRQSHRLKTVDSENVIGIPRQLKEIWTEWMRHRLSRPPGFKVQDPNCVWMFPTAKCLADAPWWSGGPGQRPCARIKAVAAEVGVYMTPLSLRHSLATHLLHWGAGKAAIQRQLRHSNTATQSFYTHCDYDNIRELANRIQY